MGEKIDCYYVFAIFFPVKFLLKLCLKNKAKKPPQNLLIGEEIKGEDIHLYIPPKKTPNCCQIFVKFFV